MGKLKTWSFSLSNGVVLLILSILFFSANFGIQEPYPENQYSIEHTSAEVTCAAYDTSGLKVPERIQFVRKNVFAVYSNITANGNIYFTNRTEGRRTCIRGRGYSIMWPGDVPLEFKGDGL